MAFPQDYAAAMTIFPQIQGYNKVVTVDIGGFTLDYLLLRNGSPELSVCDSCDNCAFSPLCFGACCPKVNLFDFADGSREEPKCPSEMNNIFETLVLIDKCIRFPYLEK